MSTAIFHSFETDGDVQAMLDASRGDSGCLAALIEKHYPGVRRYCRRHVRDTAVADELTQETFLRVYRSRFRYQASAKFTTWLYRIASNLVLNWLRDTARERGWERLDAARPSGPEIQVRDTGSPADERMAREALVAEVRRAVNALPERQRTVVMLHKFENMPGPEIAEALGCSHQAVRSHLYRAYAALREQLTELRPTVQ